MLDTQWRVPSCSSEADQIDEKQLYQRMPLGTPHSAVLPDRQSRFRLVLGAPGPRIVTALGSRDIWLG